MPRPSRGLALAATKRSLIFILKLDRTIRLYIDYRGLNKVIIKNYYLILLVSKMLDWLFKAKIFIKLDL